MSNSQNVIKDAMFNGRVLKSNMSEASSKRPPQMMTIFHKRYNTKLVAIRSYYVIRIKTVTMKYYRIESNL